MGELILYQADDGLTRLQVRLTGHTVWLTQKHMAELFQKDVRTTINEHIHHIFDEGVELQPEAVIRNYRTTAADGKNYDTQHYCSVSSGQGVQFARSHCSILSGVLTYAFSEAERDKNVSLCDAFSR